MQHEKTGAWVKGQGVKELLQIIWRPPLFRAFGKNVEILNIAVSFVTLPARNLSQDARTFELGYEVDAAWKETENARVTATVSLP
jgi:hypothetical protein